MKAARHFLKDDDVSAAEQRTILMAALELARHPSAAGRSLFGQSIGLLFEKPSLRTRASAETAAARLGAHALQLRAEELQLTRGETPQDSARVLSGYLSLLLARVYSHDLLLELAEPNMIPVINGLSDKFHPLQALADLLTLHQEWQGSVAGRKLAYLGDGNNVCCSLLLAGSLAGLHISVAAPKAYAPDQQLVRQADALAREHGGTVLITEDPHEALCDADAVYTDTWISMGDEAEELERNRALCGYQLNERLLKHAKREALVLHCLPAHREQEITAAVLDGTQSRVFKQAHNRLPTTAALYLFLLVPEICEALASLGERYES